DGTLWHLGIVLVWVAAWQWVHENVRINHFFNLLTFMSRNITSIYIIQWIVICWMLPVFGYQQSGIEATVCEICITSLMTITISFFFRRTNKTST
ncbi:MAG TPA: hypothetical protein VKR32_18545, partial [Puia sp.]|nr:hypothetical protein [Puia sp.]